MNTLEAIQARRSIRQFTEAPVPREVLAQILEAGRQAPSGKNRQPWHFVVVQGAKKAEAMEVMWGALQRREEQGKEFGSSKLTAGCMDQAPVLVFLFWSGPASTRESRTFPATAERGPALLTPSAIAGLYVKLSRDVK